MAEMAIRKMRKLKNIKVWREYWNSDNLLFSTHSDAHFKGGNFSTLAAFLYFSFFTFLNFYIFFIPPFPHISLPQLASLSKVELLVKLLAKGGIAGDPDTSLVETFKCLIQF